MTFFINKNTFYINKTNNNRMKISLSILLSCLFAVFSPQISYAQVGTLDATVDRSVISEDETLQLSLTYNGKQKSQAPDTSQLETQFDILSRNQNSRVQYINGEVNSSTQWSFTLGPKTNGKLIIPSFKLDQSFSEAIEITVKQTSSDPASVGEDVFIETIVSKESVYVQEQIVLTQRLYISGSISADQLDPENLILNDVVLEELPSSKYTKNVNGQAYYVFEYSYAIFPQSSSNITIPSLRWNLRVADNSRQSYYNRRLGSYKVKRLRTQEKQVEVKAKPSSYPANAAWLPATNIQLAERWSKDANSFQVGEPITRTITITADGLTSSQLPQFITDSKTSGVKFYIDQAQLEDEQNNNGIVGQRVESAAIVVTKTGNLNLPATRIPWWNTRTDSLEYLELPQKIVSVEGDIQNVTTNLSTEGPRLDSTDSSNTESLEISTNNAVSSFWKTSFWISILVNALLCILLIIFLAQRKSLSVNKTGIEIDRSKKVSEKTLWQTLESDLRANNMKEVRSKLLSWQKLVDTENYTTLDEISQKHGSKELKEAIKTLDSVLYGRQASTLNNEEHTGTHILQLLKNYKAKIQTNKQTSAHSSSGQLAPLHPSS